MRELGNRALCQEASASGGQGSAHSKYSWLGELGVRAEGSVLNECSMNTIITYKTNAYLTCGICGSSGLKLGLKLEVEARGLKLECKLVVSCEGEAVRECGEQRIQEHVLTE